MRMSGLFKMTSDRYPPASLGCGTLIIIALIVLGFSNAASQQTVEELTKLRNQVGELKKSVDAQADQVRGLKELIQGLSPAPRAAEAKPQN
jgi:hypothetical protein